MILKIKISATNKFIECINYIESCLHKAGTIKIVNIYFINVFLCTQCFFLMDVTKRQDWNSQCKIVDRRAYWWFQDMCLGSIKLQIFFAKSSEAHGVVATLQTVPVKSNQVWPRRIGDDNERCNMIIL